MALTCRAVFGTLAAVLFWAWPGAGQLYECELCTYWTAVPSPLSVYPTNQQFYYALADDVCYSFAIPLETYLDGPLSSKLSWEDGFTGFAYGPAVGCSPDEFERCAGFNSSAQALKVKSMIISGAKQIISKWLCPNVRGVYGFTVSTLSKYGYQNSYTDLCGAFNLNVTVMCPKPRPFPSSTCNKTAGILPLRVTNITQLPGPAEYTRLSCFNVTSVATDKVVKSSCSVTRVTQAEIWADDTLRPGVTAVRLTKNGGQPYWTTPTWGPSGSNTLRVALNWNLTEADGGEICLETDATINGARLARLCIGGKCYVSLYNDKKNCCPVSEALWPDTLPDYDYI